MRSNREQGRREGRDRSRTELVTTAQTPQSANLLHIHTHHRTSLEGQAPSKPSFGYRLPQNLLHTLHYFRVVSSLQSLIGQPHPNRERARSGSAASQPPISPLTHRVNLRQHCHHMSPSISPAFLKDVTGKGVSLLSTWVGRKKDG